MRVGTKGTQNWTGVAVNACKKGGDRCFVLYHKMCFGRHAAREKASSRVPPYYLLSGVFLKDLESFNTFYAYCCIKTFKSLIHGFRKKAVKKLGHLSQSCILLKDRVRRETEKKVRYNGHKKGAFPPLSTLSP